MASCLVFQSLTRKATRARIMFPALQKRFIATPVIILFDGPTISMPVVTRRDVHSSR